ncbi:hypothetical protein NHQ30_001262 [Ciborinia camelliae]|nr:hypothetical protein NHQ30_001262 [Ciborinia camelliae]
MTSESFNVSNSLSNGNTGFVDHEDVYPTICSSPPTPLTPIQDSLINSSIDFNFDHIDEDQIQEEMDDAIDPDLMSVDLVNLPNFETPFQMSVDPPFIIGSSFPVQGGQSLGSGFQGTNQRAFQPFTVSKPFSQSHVNNVNAPSSARVRKVDGSANLNKPNTKVNFVDPMHPRAHLKHSAIFCCQIPVCIRESKKEYEYDIRQFIINYSQPTIISPLYDGRAASVLPETANPDLRIPMLLLSGARAYKVEKLGEDKILRLFVSDIIHGDKKSKSKRYLEVLPGGTVEQMGWIDDLRDTVAGAGGSSTWKCGTHGDIWNVTVLENIFDDGIDGSATPSLSGGYDSGYASSTGQMRGVRRKGSFYGSDNYQENSVHDHSHVTTHLDGDTMMENTIASVNSLGSANPIGMTNPLEQIDEQELEELETGEVLGHMNGSNYPTGSDFMQSPQGYTWDDALLDEVNMFIASEAGSDDTVGTDYDII